VGEGQPDRAVLLQREETMRKLAAACSDGRMTLAALTARAQAASRAVTGQELQRVTEGGYMRLAVRPGQAASSRRVMMTS
jgi:hypothetical protein